MCSSYFPLLYENLLDTLAKLHTVCDRLFSKKLELGTHCQGNIPLIFPANKIQWSQILSAQGQNIKRSWFKFCLHWVEMDCLSAKYLCIWSGWLYHNKAACGLKTRLLVHMHAQSILLLLREEGGWLLSDRVYTLPKADSPQISIWVWKRWFPTCKWIVTLLQIPKPVCKENLILSL